MSSLTYKTIPFSEILDFVPKKHEATFRAEINFAVAKPLVLDLNSSLKPLR